MTYSKPEVVLLGNALTAVQGSKGGMVIEGTHVTNPAYEADE
jgi:hypothetical protein